MPKGSEARKKKEGNPGEDAGPLRLSPLRVALAAGDEGESRSLGDALLEVGATVHRVVDKRDLLSALREKTIDALVVGLPGTDDAESASLVAELRYQHDLPVVLLSQGDAEAVYAGIEAGADDVLLRPVSPRGLVYRVLSLVRRVRGQFGPLRRPIEVEDIALEPGALKATRAGRDLGLTSYEFNILYALADRRGRVCSRETLIEAAGGTAEGAFERSIDVHVSRVRQKLGDDARQPAIIKTVRGNGYLFARPSTEN
jgi:two-component system OmpR family response regulator